MNTTILEVPKRPTVADTVSQAIIRFIAENDLRAGDRLPTERDLAEMVGVSRLALREALSMLKGLGVIEARHGSGVFVKQMDVSTIFAMLSPLLRTHVEIDTAHILDVRLHLESSIAECAAAHRTEEHLHVLGDHLAAMREHVQDRAEFMKHDMAFHEELARSTGNAIYHIFMAALADLILQYQLQFPDKLEYREKGIPSHAAILDAVRAQDAERARSAMAAHIERAKAWMEEQE
ncbi:MAG: FadR/GntR family transcriptional regulator [Planctomycetota bacterium]